MPQYMVPRQMFYAGGDLDLATLQTSMWEDCDPSETGDAVILRQAVKNILYSFVNSNAMNAEVVGCNSPLWVSGLYLIDAALAALLILWGVIALAASIRRHKRLKTAG